jgi:multidrug efflux pump subunit AcrB
VGILLYENKPAANTVAASKQVMAELKNQQELNLDLKIDVVMDQCRIYSAVDS